MTSVLPSATPYRGATPLQGATLILRARGYARTCATKHEARQLERLADRLETILDAQRRLRQRSRPGCSQMALWRHGLEES